jgi:hypothetical protein
MSEDAKNTLEGLEKTHILYQNRTSCVVDAPARTTQSGVTLPHNQYLRGQGVTEPGIAIGRGAYAEERGIALGDGAYAPAGHVVISGPFTLTGNYTHK